MEGSVLSFLRTEWKVSDTGSVGWASSFLSYWKLKNEMSNIYRGPSIDVSYQVSYHLIKFPQSRMKGERHRLSGLSI
jgi:hypothetical protein